MFGQVEHVTGFKLMGTQAREGQINFQPLGPLDKQYEGIEPNAVQKEFVQQRGFDKNSLGPTNDVRQLQKDGKLEKPEKPAEAEAGEEGSEASAEGAEGEAKATETDKKEGEKGDKKEADKNKKEEKKPAAEKK